MGLDDLTALQPLLPWKDAAPQPLRATPVHVSEWFIKFQRFEQERLVPAADIAASDPSVALDVFLQHYEAFVKWRSQATPETTSLDDLAQIPWTKARSISLEKSVIPSLKPPECPVDWMKLRKELPERHREIVSLIARGYRNAEIVAALGCKEYAITAALRKGCKISGARDRAQLALAWRGIKAGDPLDKGEWIKRYKGLEKWEKENAKRVEQYYVSQTGIAVVLTIADIADLIVADHRRVNRKPKWRFRPRTPYVPTGRPRGRPRKNPRPDQEQGSL